MNFIYVVTCERKSDGKQLLHGDCYSDIEQALDLISRQSGKPKSLDNPLVWESERNIYKVHILTLAEPQSRTQSRKLENL